MSVICRYYLQAGKCFYGAECKYIHDAASMQMQPAAPAPSPSSKPTANVSSSSSGTTLLAAGAKEFTPNASASTTPSKAGTGTAISGTKLNPNKTPFKMPSQQLQQATVGDTVPASAVAEFVPGVAWQSAPSFLPVASNEEAEYAYDDAVSGVGGANDLDAHISLASSLPPPSYMGAAEFATSTAPVSGSGIVRPISLSSLSNANANGEIFMIEALRARLMHAAHLATVRLQPDEPIFANLPTTLDHERYHSLMPIQADFPPAGSEATYGRTPTGSVAYKVTSAADGRTYVVKRLQGCRVSEDRARALVQPWMDLASQYGEQPLDPSLPPSAFPVHPTILTPRACFLAKEFGGVDTISTCLVYDYLPTAAPLHPSSAYSLPIDRIWSFIVQIVSALAAIHAQPKLYAGDLLKLGRVLLTSDQRIHLSGAGCTEVLANPNANAAQQSEATIAKMRQQDFHRLGYLILGWLGFAEEAEKLLTTPSNGKDTHTIHQATLTKAWNEIVKSGVLVQAAIPKDLLDLLTLLLTPSTELTIAAVQIKIMPRITAAYTHALTHVDRLESELAKETQNGRFVRLLVKLGFITERPDASGGNWSETGDRYLLSLFRDLVFHSVHAVDVPNLDFGHVLHQLNKLDAGSTEKLLLTSRNGESMLLVRYADLKRAVQESYDELYRKQQRGLGGAILHENDAEDQQLPQQHAHLQTSSLLRPIT